MEMLINVEDYLDRDEIKRLCIEYVRDTLRGDQNNKERVLQNMAYSASFAIFDEALTPEMLHSIQKQIRQRIANMTDCGIFRKKDAWGAEDSAAYLEVKKAVEEHKHLINPLIKEAILSHDYGMGLPEMANHIAETIADAIKKGLSSNA